MKKIFSFPLFKLFYRIKAYSFLMLIRFLIFEAIFLPSTLSTFSLEESKNNQRKGFKIIEKMKIKVLPLSSILRKYMGKNKIDFFSVDSGGLDLIVLKSNDWKRFKPRVVCVEKSNHEAVKKYLSEKGYSEDYKNDINSIYLYER